MYCVSTQAGILQCARRPLGRLGSEVFVSLLAAAAVPECAGAFCAAVVHACEQHDDNRVTAGPATLAAVLAMLPDSTPETAAQAFQALRGLLGGALQPAATAACMQAMPSIIACMRRHARHEAATRYACVLGTLVHDAGARAAIVAAGGIAAVLAAMDAHPEGSAVLAAHPADYQGLQELTCIVLGGIALAADGATALVAAGGLARIVRALTAAPTARSLQEAGVLALNNAATTAANRTALVTSGGLACVCAGMAAFPDSCHIQRVGSFALYVSAQVPEGKALLLAGGSGVALLQRVISEHSVCAGTRPAAEQALAALNA